MVGVCGTDAAQLARQLRFVHTKNIASLLAPTIINSLIYLPGQVVMWWSACSMTIQASITAMAASGLVIDRSTDKGTKLTDAQPVIHFVCFTGTRGKSRPGKICRTHTYLSYSEHCLKKKRFLIRVATLAYKVLLSSPGIPKCSTQTNAFSKDPSTYHGSIATDPQHEAA